MPAGGGYVATRRVRALFRPRDDNAPALMIPAGLAHAQLFAGATTCILLGRTADIAPDLRAYRGVLWIATGTDRPPMLAPEVRLQTLAPEVFTASDNDEALEKFVRLDARHLPSVFVTPEAAEPNAAAYHPVLAHITALLESHHQARVTRQKDGFTWQKHLLGILPHYARRPLPESWRGALAGVPAFVCGAGPSLDVSAPRLATVAGQGVLFAADSALRTLARHGLAADFAVSIDPAKMPEKCLPETSHPGRVILSAISPPTWTDILSPEQFTFAASRQITTDWLANRGITPPALAVTESCGVTALGLAYFLGCAPIHLFGLDLALTATQRHTTGAEASLYAASGFEAGRQYPEVPGNYAAQVPTHAIGDWRVLDQRLAGWPADLIFNVTDRGARLRNTTVVHPEHFSLNASPWDRGRLERLPPLPRTDDVALATAFAAIRSTAQLAQSRVAGLHAALARGGPLAAAAALRPLFAHPEMGQILGGFSLKIMPHLVPPIEGDATLWAGWIDELDELLALAQDVR